MYNFDLLYQSLQQTRLHTWISTVQPQIEAIVEDSPHGKLKDWQQLFHSLPDTTPEYNNYHTNTVQAGKAADLTTEELTQLHQQLLQFSPWRKGPYQLFDIHIDTEWHSDWKWERIKNHIAPLKDKLVLDIGCGNGYHMWRMLGEDAKLVVGVDPSQLFLMQFHIMKRYLGQQLPIHILPLRGEDLPDFKDQGFDSVFSMGVLYHRKSPFDHLQALKKFIKPGGQLIIETLVVEGDINTLLIPADRYAKMRNVWFLPSVDMLTLWLERIGFTDVQTADVSTTTIEEQRPTEWMKFESLPHFLDPNQQNKTIEGYPAPLRACLTATRK